eukprot:782340-Pelagomonas_calceolata.AAC.7
MIKECALTWRLAADEICIVRCSRGNHRKGTRTTVKPCAFNPGVSNLYRATYQWYPCFSWSALTVFCHGTARPGDEEDAALQLALEVSKHDTCMREEELDEAERAALAALSSAPTPESPAAGAIRTS